jgi:hypothetical protein
MKKQSERLTVIGEQILDHLKTGHYVKNYLPGLVRVMTHDHSPVFNATTDNFQFLIDTGLVHKIDNKWILT